MKLFLAFFFAMISLNPGKGTGLVGTLPPPAQVCDYHDAYAVVPALGYTIASGQMGNGDQYVSGYVYDNRIGSPTYGQEIFIQQLEPIYYEFWIVEPASMVIPTLVIPVQGGLSKHRLYAYTLFNPVVYIGAEYWYPYATGGGFAGSGLNFAYESEPIYSSLLNANLAGLIRTWKGGQCVGTIPFNLYPSQITQSAASMVFDASMGAGKLSALKGGGLTVQTPFDSSSRNLPVVEFVGDCDLVTVDAIILNAFTSGGGIYAGVMSYA